MMSSWEMTCFTMEIVNALAFKQLPGDEYQLYKLVEFFPELSS